MYILGINAYHGDAAAALIKDGRIIAAAEEERFNRIKHCAGFPINSIQYCLREAGIGISAVDHIGIARDPSAHLSKKVLAAAKRLVESGQRAVAGLQHAEIRLAAAVIEAETREASELNQFASVANLKVNGNGVARKLVDRLRNAAKVRDLKSEFVAALKVSPSKLRAHFHNVEHHRAHLASSFFVSPFDKAALLSLDGFGDFVSTMWGVGEGNSIKVLGQVEYPHSVGLLYTATTQFLGFRHYGDEGKVMGLASYGRPAYIKEFREIIRTESDGHFRLNLDFFRHATEGVEMSWNEGSPVVGRIYSDEYAKVFGKPRGPDDSLTDRESDLAASLQLRLEEVAFHILSHLHEKTGLTDLGLAGGVAYNSVMNGKILRHTPFKRVFVQPAAGDSGTALGVCFQIWNQRFKQPRTEVMDGAYTGPQFSDEAIKQELEAAQVDFDIYTSRELVRRAARDIADGLVVGWFQGRMEFGPRALGNRSIVVDPRRGEMKQILNDRIKKREPFRPFAPAILVDRVGDYFAQTHPAPTMLMVYNIKPERRAEIPAVTHIDGSGRLQTVERTVNPRFYDLIAEFDKLTGVPVLLNTSFNENEPVVCTPKDAIDCFLKTRMDVLYLGNQVVRRES